MDADHPGNLESFARCFTAYGRDEVMKAAGEAGIEDVLIKPVTASLLFDTVMRVLGGVRDEQKSDFAMARPGANLDDIVGARILLVEDNELNQEVATELLTAAGFVVELAENGAVAVDRLAEQALTDRFDIVLMDMQMPVMDGLTATRHIRKLKHCTDFPIVAMTANAMAGDRERCLQGGMNDHVAKPIDPDVLWATLLRWVKPRSTDHQAVLAVSGKQQAATPASKFANIPGLNVATGLRQAMSKETLYSSLLGKFVSGQADFARAMEIALQKDDWKTAERLIHTLKGVSAQIGANDIRDHAQLFEVAVSQRESQPVLMQHLREISARLSDLMVAIKAQLAVKETAVVVNQVDPEKLAQVCAQLSRQLGADDFLSGATIEANESMLRAAMGKRFDKLAELIENYDFGGALSLLQTFAQQQGTTV